MIGLTPLRALGSGWRLPAPCRQTADPTAPLHLADGSVLRIEPFTRADAQAEQDFVRALSSQSRYRRFHFGLPALPASMLEPMVAVDQRRHVALAARPLGRAEIVADLRYVIDDAAGRQAEFAIALADAWQGQGLGRRLLRRLARLACSRGVQRLHGAVLRDNAPMLALVRRLGGELQALAGDAGVVQVSFETAALA